MLFRLHHPRCSGRLIRSSHQSSTLACIVILHIIYNARWRSQSSYTECGSSDEIHAGEKKTSQLNQLDIANARTNACNSRESQTYLANWWIIWGRISTCVYGARIIRLQLLIHTCLNTWDACLRWTPCTTNSSVEIHNWRCQDVLWGVTHAPNAAISSKVDVHGREKRRSARAPSPVF